MSAPTTFRGRHAALLLLAALLAAPSAEAQHAASEAADSVLAASASRSADELHPGDVVRLRIWREPELSGDFIVDERGVVTLPRVGPVRASVLPIDSLKARLLQLYERFVNQPSIEVTPLRRVQVTGAVRNPGLYTVDPTVTVREAIALAGGVTPQGRRNAVVLIRGDAPLGLTRASADRIDRSPLRSGDEVYVPQSSWISRNPGVVIGAVSATASIIWAMKRR